MLRNNHGSAGMLGIIGMLVLGLLGATFIAVTGTAAGTAVAYRDGIAAHYLAEAGAQQALVELSIDKHWQGVSNMTMGTGVAAGRYTVVVTENGQNRTIHSAGTVGNATRTVQLLVKVSDLPGDEPQPGETETGHDADKRQEAAYAGGSMLLNSGFTAIGGPVATTAAQVTNNGFTGTLQLGVTRELPTIPVSFTASDYSAVGQTTLTATPNSGNHDLSGLYYIGSSFTTNGDVNLSTSDSTHAIIFVNGNVVLSGKVNGNITIIATGNITTNSGDTITGNVQLYAQNDIELNRPMSGNIVVMSGRDLKLNSGAGSLKTAALYAARNVADFNAGVDLEGVLVAGNHIQFNGGRITYVALGFPVPAGSSGGNPGGTLVIQAWTP